jgi:TonB-dependent SusC/RagA subfamily outer membrane receptor
VDGVRVNNSTDGGPTLGGTTGQVNVLDDFNPEDIESVEIIKGPAAASLYGTEASAGVIQIITKKGREGAPEFNISVRQGTNYMRDPAQRVLGDMWTCPTDDAPGGANPGCPNASDLERYNMYDEANNYIANGYFAWPTENLFQNGHSQSYNVDVRGGTQTVRYFLSANYDNEEGFVWYNTDETFRLRANVGIVFNDHFSLDVSSGYVDGYTQFESATTNDGGLFQDLVWSNGYYLDRITPFDMTAAELATRNCAGEPGCAANPRLGGFQEHLPSDVAQDTEATRDYSRFTGSGTLNITSGEINLGGMSLNLTNRIIAGVDRGWDVNRNLFRRETYEPEPELFEYCANRGPGCVPVVWDNRYTETATGQMTFAKPVTSEYSFDYAVTAALQASESLRFNTAFGAQYNVREIEGFDNSGQGFASIFSETINQISQANITTDYELIQNKSLGFYIQEEIGFNDRLFITGALRFDDNSTFGERAEARQYPKVSGTWLVSEESFWGFDAINSLRIRGAWGKAGRQPESLAQFNVYAAAPGAGGSPAVRPSSPGNPAVEPEVSTEIEAGFDVAFLDDRLSGSFTYWTREDRNALLAIPLVASFGYPGSVDQNVGAIDNWGWEAQLSARLYESQAISFDLDLGADHTDNEIKDLGTAAGGNVITGSRIQIGLPWPNITVANIVPEAGFDDPSDGLLPACTAALVASDTLCRYQLNAFGEGVWAYCDMGVDLAPAGTPTAQINKYGRMPGGELRQCTGNTGRNIFAGRGFASYTWSVAPRVSLLDNQLQVYALAEGQYGRTGADNAHNWSHIYNATIVSRIEDDPIWVASDRANGQGCGWEKCLYDADFWKLREVGARYTLPQSWIERTGASRASLAFSARNLWTIWQAQKEVYGMPVTDPEYGNISANGSANFWEQPALTSLNVTLRVTF